MAARRRKGSPSPAAGEANAERMRELQDRYRPMLASGEITLRELPELAAAAEAAAERRVRGLAARGEDTAEAERGAEALRTVGAHARAGVWPWSDDVTTLADFRSIGGLAERLAAATPAVRALLDSPPWVRAFLRSSTLAAVAAIGSPQPEPASPPASPIEAFWRDGREPAEAALAALQALDPHAATEGEGLTLLGVALAAAIPREGRANRGARPILPTVRAQPVLLELPADQAGRVSPLMAAPPPSAPMLPGFDPPAVLEASPLAVFDRAGGVSRSPGRGAALAMRAFVELLLFADLEARGALGGVRYEITLRELVGALWPHGWRRRIHEAALRSALRQIEGLRVLLPEAPPGSGWRRSEPGLWHPIELPVLFDPGAGMEARLGVRVQLPYASRHGPRVDRAALREAGLDSAPMYRALLALAYQWHATGYQHHAIRALRGVLDDPALPPRAAYVARLRAEAAGRVEPNPVAARLPVYARDTRARLAYPEAELTGRQEKHSREMADHVLRQLERRCLVMIEECDVEGQPLSDAEGARGWRITPGPLWLRDR